MRADDRSYHGMVDAITDGAIDSSMEGTNAGAVSIEDAATVEICLSIEGFGIDVLDGAIGSVMGECFLVEAAVGSSMQ